MGSTKKRTLVKAIIYESLMFIFSILYFWIWFKSLEISLLANLIFGVIKIACYFTYDRIWRKIKWGKK